MKKNDGYNGNRENEEKEETLEVIISYVLVAGIIVSFIIITYGLLLYYIAPPTRTSPASHLAPNWQIRTGSDYFTYFAGLLSYFTTDPVRIIGLGTVLLIITPFVRVVASAIFFGYRRNFKYLLITSFVLIVLIFSLTMHR